jgi:hypothetical protein
MKQMFLLFCLFHIQKRVDSLAIGCPKLFSAKRILHNKPKNAWRYNYNFNPHVLQEQEIDDVYHYSECASKVFEI